VLKEKDAVKSMLTKHQFKGNVREMENIARRFCLLFHAEKHQGSINVLLEACMQPKTTSRASKEASTDLKTLLEATEKNILLEMAKRYKNKNDISRILNVDRATIWRRFKKYGIQP
jgi:transcriptional regulator with PAS, ATPase and Fis domain